MTSFLFFRSWFTFFSPKKLRVGVTFVRGRNKHVAKHNHLVGRWWIASSFKPPLLVRCWWDWKSSKAQLEFGSDKEVHRRLHALRVWFHCHYALRVSWKESSANISCQVSAISKKKFRNGPTPAREDRRKVLQVLLPYWFFLALKNLFFAGSETAVRRRCAFQPVDAAMRKNFVQNLQRLRHHFRCTLPSPPTREILLAHARGARASPLKI